jgi:hypothetical protein
MSQPDNFEMLAAYNAERARDIVHTPEWDARMAALQVKFDEAVAAKLPDYRTADGTYIFPGYDRMPEALWDSIRRALTSAHQKTGEVQ